MSWVKGYILALEDVIKDIGLSSSGDIMDHLDQINRTLTEANATLEHLHQMKDEHQDWAKFSGNLEPEQEEKDHG